MIELSPDQQSCFDIIMDWYRSREDLLTMGGYAGSGKTTLIGKLRGSLSESTRVAFCAYTGKAASVLRSKLNLAFMENSDDYCGTIHSLIYEPLVDDETNEITGWVLKPLLDYDLIIIDESSMISEDLFSDLKSFHIPMLYVGDHGQLPPIEGTLNLMSNPIIKLEKVHRFAEHDPLTKISILAREQGYIAHGTYGDFVHKVPPKHSLITDFINNSDDFSNTAILCGFNNTRVSINEKIRNWGERKGKLPRAGEKVICLKNNKDAKECPIYNGVLGIVTSCESYFDHLNLTVKIDGEIKSYRGKVSRNIFNNSKPDLNEFIWEESKTKQPSETRFISMANKPVRRKRYLDCFDFGYALTVHKSQGSEWGRVMVIEQPCSYWSGDNWNRWLYTAVTRSTKQLLIVR